MRWLLYYFVQTLRLQTHIIIISRDLTSCVLHGMDYNFLTVGANDAGELGVTPAVAFNLWYRAIMDPASATLTNDYKWVEDLDMPRVDNPLACPPFAFAAARG